MSLPSDTLRDDLQASLGTPYSLERELGGGGMSRVFVAQDGQLGRSVVVKVLAPDLAQAVSVERFTREVRLAAALQEPHIVPVLSAGTTAGGLPYYTMPYVRGSSLRQRLAAGPLPLAESVSILRDVAKALGYAHERGIVHRDVKPENVLLSSGTAVVTDFGIAKALALSTLAPRAGGSTGVDALTQVGTLLGTPAYMAPEQAAGDPDTDHRADLYAWGVIAYELVAGRHPFAEHASTRALLVAHMTETPAALGATTGGDLPRALAALVMRCLAKNPAKRPASAAEIIAVLDRGVAAGGMSSRSWRMRVGAACAAALVGLSGGLAWRAHRIAADHGAAGPLLLAVLPFEHEGPPDQSAFTDGLTDAVTAKLGKLSGLAVIDRRSAAQYRQTRKPARQIGEELGAPMLVEGVVRWARGPAGTWRAQVTPTLVDARTGTTRWTGEPIVITPDDPFTAQGAVATQVAEALKLALRPADRVTLARRLSEEPEAYAAYERGRTIADASQRLAASPYDVRRSAAEFEHAVSLDSSFAEAWGWLATTRLALAQFTPGDGAVEAQMRATLAEGLRRAPREPRLLLALATARADFDHDTAGIDALLELALAGAPNDVGVLSVASLWLAARNHRYEDAYTFARRAARLDPRSAGPVTVAAAWATNLRRWDEARRFDDALIALDSTDERGWSGRAYVEWYRGDTIALRRELARALARLPHPSSRLLGLMATAGAEYGQGYAALSARELGIATLHDSASNYYSNKADAWAARGDAARERVYYDSIRTMLDGRRVSGGTEGLLLATLALAQATLGDQPAARRTLARTLDVAKGSSSRSDFGDALDPVVMAGIYSRLGDDEAAVRWLEATLAYPAGRWTARGFAVQPKLRALHRTPAFARFLQAHPE